jgi:hypothetical protein
MAWVASFEKEFIATIYFAYPEHRYCEIAETVYR